MKPLNPYQGPEPKSIAMMGYGIPEMGANIARTMQGGYEAMGKGLASGINTAVNEYTKYKDMQSAVKASEKSYEALKNYLPEDVRNTFDNQIQKINEDPNLSLRDKASFWDQTKSFLGGAVGQAFKMQQQQQDQAAAMARMQAELTSREQLANLGIMADVAKTQAAMDVKQTPPAFSRQPLGIAPNPTGNQYRGQFRY